MKNLIFILFSILLFSFGCNSDDAPKESDVNQNNLLSHVDINEIKANIPDFYIDNTKIIFKDENNLEKKFNVYRTEEEKSNTIDGFSYSSDNLLIKLISDDSSPIIIELRGIANYDDEYKLQKSLSMSFAPTSPGISGTSSFTVIFFENGQPLASMFGVKVLEESVVLLGKEFNNVYGYSNMGEPISDSYGQLLFNSTNGVIGFRDRNNKLWVFERFE